MRALVGARIAQTLMNGFGGRSVHGPGYGQRRGAAKPRRRTAGRRRRLAVAIGIAAAACLWLSSQASAHVLAFVAGVWA